MMCHHRLSVVDMDSKLTNDSGTVRELLGAIDMDGIVISVEVDTAANTRVEGVRSQWK
jgi:hypothetical protein